MSRSPEAACAALFTLVSSQNTYPWVGTPSRRLKLWGDVPPATQPNLYQFEGGQRPYEWTGAPNPKRTINVKLFAYFQASDANPGATTLNAIWLAIDQALQVPPGPFSKQTLSGTCDNARIKSVPLAEPGDIDGQAILIVEVEIILP